MPDTPSNSSTSSGSQPDRRKQVNQATTYASLGHTMLNTVVGLTFGPNVTKLFGDVAKYSPVRNAATAVNIATADRETYADRALIACNSYAWLGNFCTHRVFRFAPGVGYALIAKDAHDIVMPYIVDAVETRAAAGNTACIAIRDTSIQVARQASDHVTSFRSAVQTMTALPSHEQTQLVTTSAQNSMSNLDDCQQWLSQYSTSA